MRGPNAEPCERIIKLPKSAKVRRIGANQYFFLTFKNLQNSIKKLIK